MLALCFIGLELYALEVLPILLGESKLFPPSREACESEPSAASYCPNPDNPYSFQAAYGHASFWLGLPMACLLSFGPRLAIKGWHGVVGTPTKNAMLVRSRRRADRNHGMPSVLVERDGEGSEGLPSPGGVGPSGRELSRRSTGTGYAFSENEPASCRVLTRTSPSWRPGLHPPPVPPAPCAWRLGLRRALGGGARGRGHVCVGVCVGGRGADRRRGAHGLTCVCVAPLTSLAACSLARRRRGTSPRCPQLCPGTAGALTGALRATGTWCPCSSLRGYPATGTHRHRPWTTPTRRCTASERGAHELTARCG